MIVKTFNKILRQGEEEGRRTKIGTTTKDYSILDRERRKGGDPKLAQLQKIISPCDENVTKICLPK